MRIDEGLIEKFGFEKAEEVAEELNKYISQCYFFSPKEKEGFKVVGGSINLIINVDGIEFEALFPMK